ncbi:hypothetical protein LINPERPRIM_LOCUS29677 [Linum perenne]
MPFFQITKKFLTPVGTLLEAFNPSRASSINSHFSTFTLVALSSHGLINKLRRFKVDSIVSLPPHVGCQCSFKAQCDTSMIWARTTERLHGSLLFLETHIDNTFLTMFVGIKMRKFVTLFLRFGTIYTQLAPVCSLSKQSFRKFVASSFNGPAKEKLILPAVSVPFGKTSKSFEIPTLLTGTESDLWKESSVLL